MLHAIVSYQSVSKCVCCRVQSKEKDKKLKLKEVAEKPFKEEASADLAPKESKVSLFMIFKGAFCINKDDDIFVVIQDHCCFSHSLGIKLRSKSIVSWYCS